MEKQLVEIENNQVVVDSRSVAEHFGKRHDHVMRDVNNLLVGIPKIGDTPIFYKTTYINEQNGQKYPMYLMNRDGFSLLVMGFTGKKALEWKLKYIEAFNEMEKELKRRLIAERTDSYMIADPVERAKKWIEEETERQKLRTEVKMLTPKAEFFDTVASSESLLSMGEVAKTLNMGVGRNNLFLLLRVKGILNFDNVPYQRYINAGYFKLVERAYDVNGNPKVATTTYVSQKGLDYIRKMLLKDGYRQKLN